MYNKDLQILEKQTKEELEKMELLEEDRKKINSPESLIESIKTVVWDQFVNQIGIYAGEEFIKKNKGLTLDLSKEAHTVDVDEFMHGKFPEHNTIVNYKERYEKWKENLKTDSNDMQGNSNARYNEDIGAWETRHNENSDWQFALKDKNVRKPYDDGRAKGNVQEHMDHTISVKELIADPKANAALSQEERIEFANSSENLQPLDAAANQSKGDRKMDEWLDSKRESKTPGERFNIDEKELKERDANARETLEKKEATNIEKAASDSRKNEAKRIGNEALKALAMALLANLLREICSNLYKWFKSKSKSLKTLWSSLKQAFKNFIRNWKKHMLNGLGVVSTTLVTAIFEPVKTFFQKAWIFLKQGFRTIKDSYKYLTDKANRGLPFETKFLGVSKIIIGGLAACGAIFAGEVISKWLTASMPALGYPIPGLGSFANLIGMLLGGIVAGIAGALVIHFITKLLRQKFEEQATRKIIDQGNEVVALKGEAVRVAQTILEENTAEIGEEIIKRHEVLQVKIDGVKDAVKNAVSKTKLTKNECVIFDAMHTKLQTILVEGEL